ncbi:DgyrCDS477 [Dimorphilus gyrociliatus]|uniref:Large ribosomal subunit protein mL38 n=1 Tax=Dimorphilus gyrociliatus TaxID=2664684 RepID=A0A7I8V963_9ANNE|nr:DgyrCDS477 [Dimorphilus gyrociliatus]
MAVSTIIGRACRRNANILGSIKRWYSIEPPESISGPKLGQLGVPDNLVKNPLSFTEKIANRQIVDEEIIKVHNIGFPFTSKTASYKNRLKTYKKYSSKTELSEDDRIGRTSKAWLEEEGPLHKLRIAEHFGIFEHLFEGAYFYPIEKLVVAYDYDHDFVSPVYYGNRIYPADAQKAPLVRYASDNNTKWSLILTNPDGNLIDNQSECLHWFIGNIPGNNIEKGDFLCNYLPPFPPRGTGLHRMVFLLFKQSGEINFEEERRTNSVNLQQRTFKVADLFKKHSADLTPAGLSFFQTEYDDSVRETFHKTLDMKEPSYEYDFDPFYISPIKEYPHKEPFDKYYDRYRDKKDIGEEVLKLKMKMMSPFKPYEPEFKYPGAHEHYKTQWGKHYKPTWLMRREMMMNRRLAQYKSLP